MDLRHELGEMAQRWEADAKRARASALRQESDRVRARLHERADMCHAHALELTALLNRTED